MAFEAVLIDLDGTLWDSAPWYASLLSPDDLEKQREIAGALMNAAGGPRAANLLRAAYSPTAFAKAAARKSDRLALFDGAVDVLEGLRDHVYLGVVTSLPAWMARPMLHAVGLFDVFQVVQTAVWRQPAKPHPASLNLALEALGIRADKAVYVGDTSTDEQASQRAGMSFIGAGWGYGRLRGEAAAHEWREVLELL